VCETRVSRSTLVIEPEREWAVSGSRTKNLSNFCVGDGTICILIIDFKQILMTFTIIVRFLHDATI
jgi:hypothetical protein